jgi:F420-dependent oxidoreductase-like protein
MDVGLMVEGQAGLTWGRWLHILRLAEELRIPSVHRSDHFFIGQQRESLEAYLSFAVAARETTRLRFGPMVTPVTFRTPVDVGRMAAQLDELSEGRFVLGLGAGWNEPEHRAYGIPFPPIGERMNRLEDAIRMMRALWTGSPATYAGRYYPLEGADLLPKPPAGRPRLIIGGRGEKRLLRMVARYADEWNTTPMASADYARARDVLAAHCEAEGRDPATIRRSMMMFAIIGEDDAAIERATARMMRIWPQPGVTPAEFRARMGGGGLLVGSTDHAVEHLGHLAGLGVSEVQLQHLDFDDDDFPRYVASEIAPQVAGL